jgi:uncharacterized FlaG/YvyC family protein
MEINGLSEMAVSDSHAMQSHPVFVPQLTKKEAPPPAMVQEQQSNEKARTQRVVEDIQRNLRDLAVSLTFSTYGKNNNQVSIIVAEKETGKVIREIPSRELQSLSTKMQELVGMILNKSV